MLDLFSTTPIFKTQVCSNNSPFLSSVHYLNGIFFVGNITKIVYLSNFISPYKKWKWRCSQILINFARRSNVSIRNELWIRVRKELLMYPFLFSDRELKLKILDGIVHVNNVTKILIKQDFWVHLGTLVIYQVKALGKHTRIELLHCWLKVTVLHEKQLQRLYLVNPRSNQRKKFSLIS